MLEVFYFHNYPFTPSDHTQVPAHIKSNYCSASEKPGYKGFSNLEKNGMYYFRRVSDFLGYGSEMSPGLEAVFEYQVRDFPDRAAAAVIYGHVMGGFENLFCRVCYGNREAGFL